MRRLLFLLFAFAGFAAMACGPACAEVESHPIGKS